MYFWPVVFFFDLASENTELLAKTGECFEKLIHTPASWFDTQKKQPL
jgi:hypothetical protein